MKKIMLVAAASLMVSLASCGGKSETKATETDSTAVVAEAAQPQDAVIVLTGDEFTPEAGKVTVIDFNATWCGPCKMYGPTFHEVADEYASKAAFYSVDTDVNPNVAQKYVGQYIPQTTIIAADGQTFSKTGQLSKEELTAFVDSVLAIPAK